MATVSVTATGTSSSDRQRGNHLFRLPCLSADTVIGPNTFPYSGITDAQARAQFTLWALLPAPLIIGNNLLAASPYYFETVLNTELIAINQDLPFISAARRVVGGDIDYPCTPTPAEPLLCINVWSRPLSAGAAGIVFFSVGPANTTATVTCAASCFAAAGITADTAPLGATPRDLWAHADLPVLMPPYSLTVTIGGDGDARGFRVIPVAHGSSGIGNDATGILRSDSNAVVGDEVVDAKSSPRPKAAKRIRSTAHDSDRRHRVGSASYVAAVGNWQFVFFAVCLAIASAATGAMLQANAVTLRRRCRCTTCC